MPLDSIVITGSQINNKMAPLLNAAMQLNYNNSFYLMLLTQFCGTRAILVRSVDTNA